MIVVRQQCWVLAWLAQSHYSLPAASYVNRVQGLPKARTCQHHKFPFPHWHASRVTSMIYSLESTAVLSILHGSLRCTLGSQHVCWIAVMTTIST
jgi:hypothetical protein